ncbi:sigma-70 family RNA polymerase sigma factor [Dactylosporangium sp. AC04546]|uniref:sigma-70 family RNA polymerase sigma factor n=1 Tax=Dactylosporangium sp. AC04546 TaxID=2862460 RepID=UPI001EE14A70|nr:sigma-70 family RNA polymerase sigma factor [Dactylosporangium sp. AC04546]WVK88294.1 sigma-70 family RNA polymerase sigma factor [Dactylosporangium sp. AC04546]
MADADQGYVDYVSARLPALHRAAYLLCGDAHLADDVVQQTITALYVHWSRARRADNLDAYVHRMLVRKLIDEKRLGWAKVRLLGWTPEPPPEPPFAEDLADRDEMTALLGTLPKGQRTVLVLRYLCDLSLAETAAVMRCSEGNVKAQASRALAAVRQALGVLERSRE